MSNCGREMHFDIDDALPTGSARITSKQSLVEVSHEERMRKVFELVDSQCEKLDLADIAGEQAEAEMTEADDVEYQQDSDTLNNDLDDGSVDDAVDNDLDDGSALENDADIQEDKPL